MYEGKGAVELEGRYMNRPISDNISKYPRKFTIAHLLKIGVTIALHPRQLKPCRLDLKSDSRSLKMYNMYKIEYVEERGAE